MKIFISLLIAQFFIASSFSMESWEVGATNSLNVDLGYYCKSELGAGKKITISKSIVWDTNSILALEADEIEFEKDVIIKNTGEGGLALRAKQVKFFKDFHIDFLNSSGIVCVMLENDSKIADNIEKYIITKDNNNFVQFICADYRCYGYNKENGLLELDSNKNYFFDKKFGYNNSDKEYKNFNGKINFYPKDPTQLTGYPFESYLDGVDNLFKNFNQFDSNFIRFPPDKKIYEIMQLLKKEDLPSNMLEEIEILPDCNLRNYNYNCLLSIDSNGNTILHYASRFGRISTISQIYEIINKVHNGMNDINECKKRISSRLKNFVNRKNFAGKSAVELAIDEGHLESIQALIIFYEKIEGTVKEELLKIVKEKWDSWNNDIAKIQAIFQSMTLSNNKIKEKNKIYLSEIRNNPYTIIQDFISQLFDRPKKFSKEFEGYQEHLLDKALVKEVERAQKASERFFSKSSKNKKDVIKLMIEEFSQYNKNEFILNEMPARSRIFLHKNLIQLQNSKASLTRELKFKEDAIIHEWKRISEGMDYKTGESFKIYQLGNGYYNNINNENCSGRYIRKDQTEKNSIQEVSKTISNKITNENIFNILINSFKSGNGIKGVYLKNIVPEWTEDESNSTAEFLTQLSFLMNYEVTRRLYKDEYGELSSIGVGNARFFTLFKYNKLSFDKLFDARDNYHPFSGDVRIRKTAVVNINKLFQQYANYQNLDEIQQWKKLNPNGIIIKTREGMHKELLEMYDNTNSSDEEYISSDEEESN